MLHKTDHSFSYYAIETGEQIAYIRTRPYPHEICLSPDRRRFYIAEMGVRGVESSGVGGHTIAVYDTKTLKLLSTIDTDPYDRPHGLATHANGRLLVTSESTKTLLIYDMNSEALLYASYLDQDGAHMVNVDPNGKQAYTANIFSNTITEVDVETGTVNKHIDVLERPEGIVFSKDAKLLYVVNRESQAVSIVDRTLGRQIDVIETDNGPVRVVITPDGRQLVIPLFHSEAVQIVDTEKRTVTHTIAVGPHPAGTAMSPDGKLAFISCEDENQIYTISMDTLNIVSSFNTGPGCDAMVCLYRKELDARYSMLDA